MRIMNSSISLTSNSLGIVQDSFRAISQAETLFFNEDLSNTIIFLLNNIQKYVTKTVNILNNMLQHVKIVEKIQENFKIFSDHIEKLKNNEFSKKFETDVLKNQLFVEDICKYDEKEQQLEDIKYDEKTIQLLNQFNQLSTDLSAFNSNFDEVKFDNLFLPENFETVFEILSRQFKDLNKTLTDVRVFMLIENELKTSYDYISSKKKEIANILNAVVQNKPNPE